MFPTSPLLYLDRGGVFVAPAISAFVAISLWREGELFGTTLYSVVCWFVLAFALQLLALFRGSPIWWIMGLLGQTALAIFLVVKRQLTRW